VYGILKQKSTFFSCQISSENPSAINYDHVPVSGSFPNKLYTINNYRIISHNKTLSKD
jgi:hypothetical protein